ncbi:MAG: nucleotidyltransferase family protein [Deltaproteobacteria bacterium]|nr:nucleotidyltransferase family protein [Deltaproteobacteria bacterium]
MEFRREENLLLGLLGADDGSYQDEGIHGISASDWDSILQLSKRHSVAPFLYQRIKRLDPGEEIVPEVYQRLRDIYLYSAALNMRLYHKLAKVLKILKDEGIPVIVLKGAYLAGVVYNKIGMRAMQDVDLLFKIKDLSRAQKILIEKGYCQPDSSLFLDIHWNIELSYADLNVEIEKVWERAKPADIAGVEVLVLCPEDLLLHLCMHLGFHHLFEFAGLRTLCDILETIRHYNGQIDWGQVRHRAIHWRVINLVYLALLLARDLLSADVPDSVMEDFKPDEFDPRVKEWALEQIFRVKADTLSLSPYFWQLWRPGSFREKATSLLKLIFPSPEFISQKYPTPYGSSKNYLYYLVRLKDHFYRYGHAMWRILIRDKEMAILAKQHIRDLAMREWLSS